MSKTALMHARKYVAIAFIAVFMVYGILELMAPSIRISLISARRPIMKIQTGLYSFEYVQANWFTIEFVISNSGRSGANNVLVEISGGSDPATWLVSLGTTETVMIPSSSNKAFTIVSREFATVELDMIKYIKIEVHYTYITNRYAEFIFKLS